MTAGLAVCEDLFHPSQFNWFVYKSGSGLTSPEHSARSSYYGVGGIPHLEFDGVHTIIGASSNAADGRFYIPVIEARNAELVPLAMAITDYSFQSGSAFAEVKLKLFGDLANINNSFIRVAVIENNVQSGSTIYNNVLRRLLTAGSLTISQEGQEQTASVAIPMSIGWNVANLWLIAFVQRDTDTYVFNSTSSRVGEFSIMATVDGPQQVIADDPLVTFGETTLTNVGFGSDTLDISLDLGDLPEGWDAHFTYDGQDLTSVQVDLNMFETAQLTVSMQIGATGSGRAQLVVYSQGADEVLATLDFAALTGGTDLLVIADDDGAGHAYSAYAPALASTNKSFAIWDRGLAPLVGSDLLPYDAVIWASGSNNKTINAGDRVALDAYMNAGGRLILAGEDLIESLHTNGATVWIQLRLRFVYSSGNSGNLQINGVPGDVIGDGLSFTLTGGDPDLPALVSGQPVEASCHYGNGQPAVLRTTYNDYKVVFMPFGLERVPSQELRNTLVYRSLEWLDVLGVTSVGDLPGATLALHQNAPNPFNPFTEITFSTERTSAVRLEIFNARGQLVRVLIDDVLAAGSHAEVWDGRTRGGEQAASGMYFYRLITDGESLTRKMTLVK